MADSTDATMNEILALTLKVLKKVQEPEVLRHSPTVVAYADAIEKLSRAHAVLRTGAIPTGTFHG